MTDDQFAIFETWNYDGSPSYFYKARPTQAEAARYIAGLLKEILATLEAVVTGSVLIATDALATPGLRLGNASIIGQATGVIEGMCFELYHLLKMIGEDLQHASGQEVDLPEWRAPTKEGPRTARRATFTLYMAPDKLRGFARLVDVNLPAALDASTTRTRMIDFPRRARVQASFEALAAILEDKHHLLLPTEAESTDPVPGS